jgi:hypothetical protein
LDKAVAFATPSLNHSVSMEFFCSSMQTDWLLAAHGYKRSYLNHCGDQFIAKARNKLVNDFLLNHPDIDNFFFIDDDLGWPAEKVLEFCERDEDIIVGVYPKKSDEPDWPVMIAGENGGLVEKDGLVRCLRAPTGFMRIKRRVFEGLLPHAPTFMDTNLKGETETTPAFMAAGVAPDGWFWTEDYILCQNADASGFEIWCDPDIEFKHRGNKVWTGRLADDLHIFRDRAAQAHDANLKASAPIPITTGRRKRSNAA